MLRGVSSSRSAKRWVGLIIGVLVGIAGLRLTTFAVQSSDQDSSGPKQTGACDSGVDEVNPLIQLKQLGKAMVEFHLQHDHYPTATFLGPDGETLHSWRVALLPLLGHQELYDEYRLNEPWNSNHNKTIIHKMPSVYRSTSRQDGPTYSRWLAVTGPETAFHNDSGTLASSIRDGTANTAMLVEARCPVPWTKPEDIVIRPGTVPHRFGGSSDEGFHVLLCEGSSCFVSKETPRHIVEALLTRAGGESLGPDVVGPYLTFHWAR